MAWYCLFRFIKQENCCDRIPQTAATYWFFSWKVKWQTGKEDACTPIPANSQHVADLLKATAWQKLLPVEVCQSSFNFMEGVHIHTW